MKKHKLYFIFSLTFLLVSCWDNIPIEDRAFIIGTAIDVDDKGDNTFLVTNQIVIPAGITNPAQQSQEEKPFINIPLSGNNVHTINHELSSKTSKIPFFRHLVILIISEEVAHKGQVFSDIFDAFIRDTNVNRSVKVVITKKDAKDILNHTTVEERLPAIHISSLIEENMEQFGKKITFALGNIDEYLLDKRSFIIPYITETNEINFNAGAVFHGEHDKMIGHFNENEMTGLELIQGNSQNNVIEVNYKNNPVDFDIYETKSKIKIDVNDVENLKVNIHVTIDGIVKETIGYTNLLKKTQLDKMEKLISEQAEKFIWQAIHKGQKEYSADVFDIIKVLRAKHYNTYKKVESEWDHGKNYFSNITFHVDVKTNIHSIGTINKTRRKQEE